MEIPWKSGNPMDFGWFLRVVMTNMTSQEVPIEVSMGLMNLELKSIFEMLDRNPLGNR